MGMGFLIWLATIALIVMVEGAGILPSPPKAFLGQYVCQFNVSNIGDDGVWNWEAIGQQAIDTISYPQRSWGFDVSRYSDPKIAGYTSERLVVCYGSFQNGTVYEKECDSSGRRCMCSTRSTGSDECPSNATGMFVIWPTCAKKHQLFIIYSKMPTVRKVLHLITMMLSMDTKLQCGGQHSLVLVSQS
jgi:hypothetical protein